MGIKTVSVQFNDQSGGQSFRDSPDSGKLAASWACRACFRKVFLVDLLQGLKVTFRYQDPKEIYTEQYPLERPQVAERYRGAPRLNVNPDTDETMCIACDLCALACPENLIVVSSERNEKTRRKELTNFTYDLSRCMFCGLCEDACPTDALELTQDFELASYTRDGWIWDREDAGKRSAAHAIQEIASKPSAAVPAARVGASRRHPNPESAVVSFVNRWLELHIQRAFPATPPDPQISLMLRGQLLFRQKIHRRNQREDEKRRIDRDISQRHR